MFDQNKGILVLDNSQDINMPNIYVTNNAGKDWQEIKFSYFNLPDEITYITNVDTITYEDGYYNIKLGQGLTGTLKVIFKTGNLAEPWSFVTTKRENIHTVG